MKQLRIPKANFLQGEISVPGDKSISHRAAIIAALADGVSEIHGFLESEDCLNTIKCLRQLEIDISRSQPGSYTINGKSFWSQPNEVLDVGNSGTAIRLLTGVLSAQPINSIITGDASIRSRPMKRIIEPLTLMGANITGQENNTLAPLSIHGKKLNSIEYFSPLASAQVKSAVLLAALQTEGLTAYHEPYLSRDHTERLLQQFEVNIDSLDGNISIEGMQKLNASKIDIPGDISSAMFFIAAALLVENSVVAINNVGVNPTRTGCLDAMKSIEEIVIHEDLNAGEPTASITVSDCSNILPFHISGVLIPRLIDEIPILTLVASQANGVSTIHDASELRVKESDRISTITTELRKLGAKIEETTDGLIIEGPTPLKGCTVDSHGDHRIAMTLAIAGLIAEGETIVNNTDCIETSYPGFEAQLKLLHH